MVAPFAVTKLHEGAGVFRLVVIGDLDEGTSDGLSRVIGNAIEQGDVSGIVVDLCRVTFLAAAGVNALLRGRDAAADRGCAFRVVNATGIVYQVLRICGVHRALDVPAEAGSTPR